MLVVTLPALQRLLSASGAEPVGLGLRLRLGVALNMLARDRHLAQCFERPSSDRRSSSAAVSRLDIWELQRGSMLECSKDVVVSIFIFFPQLEKGLAVSRNTWEAMPKFDLK